MWIFGLPEIITTYPSISISSIKQFTKDSNETIFILSSYLLTVSISIFATLSNLSKHKKLLILNLIFFLTSLLPVLFLKDHKYPQYLDKAFIVLLPTIAFSIIGLKKISRLYLTIFIISYMILQFLSLRLTERIHWTTHRSEIASYYLSKLRSQDIKNKNIVFYGEESKLKEVSYALAIGYAPKVYFPNQINEVVYQVSNEVQKYPENQIIINIDKY